MDKSAGRSKKRRQKKLPDGNEIMERRAPSDLSLRLLGAITLKWNQIEAHIDFIGSFILFGKSPSWLQLATDKALSTKAKLSLLKGCMKNATLLDNRSKQCVAECFSQIEQVRTYRNAIIHHHIYDHEKGIGAYVDDSNSAYQIPVSIDALKLLYGVLCTLLDELREIDLLFRLETGTQRPGWLDSTTGEFHSLNDDELKKSVIPQHTKRIMVLQKSRKELQKLPKFPDADLIRSMNERDDGRIG